MNKLTKVALHQLNNIKTLYSVDRKLNALIINSIANILYRAEKKPSFLDNIQVYCLNDNIKENGTVLIKNGSNFFVSTLEDPPYKSLRTAVFLINPEKEMNFVFISDRFKSIIEDFVWFNGLTIEMCTGHTGYFITKEEMAQSFQNNKLPDGFEIRPLVLSNAEEINTLFPREGNLGLEYIKTSIIYKTSMGIFEKSSNNLAAAAFEGDCCSMALGIVKPEFQRSRFAQILTTTIAKKVAIERRLDINFKVRHGHTVSHYFCKSIGGQVYDTFTSYYVKNEFDKHLASRFGAHQIFY